MITHSFFSAQNSLMKVARIATVIVGGYTFTAALCHWLKWLTPVSDQEARLLVNMSFFIIYLLVLMALFCGSNHRRIIAITLVGNAVLWAPWLLLVQEAGV
ncbi:hypothetical protein [Gilvimarinus chinensis]|uniref:hypothetical protein n=1 Tax=Gilvimarinus chinensis TaxID=396005 RepID=UPI00036A0696|nr:hypothetical protein [Gilvimarinus chinensis]